MSKLRTIIVEDDLVASKSLELLLPKLQEVELVSIFSDAESALAYLAKESVDLIFLDVQMPGMSGIEMLEELHSVPEVVMTTSSAEYASDAFELEVRDFLLKPITLPRLKAAMAKVRKAKEQLDELAYQSKLNEIYIRVDGVLTRIPIEQLLYFENVGDYVKVITESKSYIIYGALKAIALRLKHPRLLKVHRSYIVNLGKIKDIEDNSISLENGKIIPVSRAHKNLLMDSLNIL